MDETSVIYSMLAVAISKGGDTILKVYLFKEFVNQIQRYEESRHGDLHPPHGGISRKTQDEC
jgi:hypothetical protein